MAELGIESRGLIPKIVFLSIKQELETVSMGLPWKGFCIQKTRRGTRGEKFYLGFTPSLNLFGIWTGDSIGLSMWQLQLLPSLTPPGGPLRYVIFLSDIPEIFYDSFLEHQLFNSFPMD